MTDAPRQPQTHRIRTLDEGRTEAADRFRYGLLGFDVLTIAFLLTTSFVDRGPHVLVLDICIGAIILVDVLARFT